MKLKFFKDANHEGYRNSLGWQGILKSECVNIQHTEKIIFKRFFKNGNRDGEQLNYTYETNPL